jgi:hypothetical protein
LLKEEATEQTELAPDDNYDRPINREKMTNDTNIGCASSPGWPYSSGSSLIDPDTARSIRAWALTVMSEAELHAHSQRQILHRYIVEHVHQTIAKICPEIDNPEIQAATVKDLSELFGRPESTIKEILGIDQ